MKEFIKKQSLGFYFSLVVALLTTIALILYSVNSSSGYFKDAISSFTVFLGICSIFFLLISIGIQQIKLNEKFDKVLIIADDVLRVLAIIMLMYCTMDIISSRVYGLSVILFSDPNMDQEVKIPNLGAATLAIWTIITFISTWVIGVVSLFFKTETKKVEEAIAE